MKLNGIIILRITDFRRFFDFDSFWARRKEFLQLVKPNGTMSDCFFDTEEEKALCKIVCKWIEGGLPNQNVAKIQGGKTLWIRIEGRSCPIALNMEVQKANEQLERNGTQWMRRIGLVCLFQMLGVGEKDSEAVVSVAECLQVLNIGEIDFSESYIPIFHDTVIPSINDLEFPLSIKTIVNKSKQPIHVTGGNEKVVLEYEGCVNGLFHGDKCCKLLPRIGKNEKVHLTLRFNERTRKTDLDVDNGKGLIEDVVSFYINEVEYVYINWDGNVGDKLPYRISLKLGRIPFLTNEKILWIYENNSIVKVITDQNRY